MPFDTCPHCGDKLPIVRDAFCGTCDERLDEPPTAPRSPEDQRTFRLQIEQEAKQHMSIFKWILRLLTLSLTGRWL
jgi:hypothetical protein